MGSYDKKRRKQQREQQKIRQRAAVVSTVSGTPAAKLTGQGPADAEPTLQETSTCLCIDPLAPVIVRSGRPFDAQSGPDPARFPPPSTLAGCMRTAWARHHGVAFSPDLLKHEVRGPLLWRDGEILVPKPADTLYFGHGEAAQAVRAMPCALDADSGCDLPDGLLPVRLSQEIKGKPGTGPSWWRLADLATFRMGGMPSLRTLSEHGWSPPPGDLRTHVGIHEKSGAAKQGILFQTVGLDLGASLKEPGLQLLVRFAEPLPPALVHLGGERRLAQMRPMAEASWPQAPETLTREIQEAKGLVLTLLTPGLFAAGYRPAWLNEGLDDGSLCGTPPDCPGLKLRLRAAACERWQPQSGWDLAKRQPRATRKMIPAGAVYWFEILECADSADLERLWLSSIADQPQDRLDGYALSHPAPWRPTEQHIEE